MRNDNVDVQSRQTPIGLQRGPSADEQVRVRPDAAPASLVIPAHDEEAAIGRCLRALLADPVGARCEIVVVANGCQDQTAAVARTFANQAPRLTVVERPKPGKIGALNAGDDAATCFPRIYLDADVVLEPGALPALVATLDRDEPVVAAPAVSFDVTGASSAVRAFYQAYAELPYVREGLVGLGVYGVSEAGRHRFGEFPPVVADDLFVQRCFAPHERVTTPGRFTVFVPRRARDLVRVRRRTVGGAQQLAEVDTGSTDLDTASTSSGTLRALVRLALSRPGLAWPTLVYAVVNLLGRVRPVRDAQRWTRDASSRATVPDPADPSTVVLDGLPLWSATAEDVVGHVLSELERGRGGVIATPNVDIMRTSYAAGNEVLDRVDVLVPDGMPLLWASRVQGQPIRERITGADLVWALSLAADAADRSVFLLGGAPGVADRAAAAFGLLSPTLRVAGTACPPVGFDADPIELATLEEQLVEARPDIVFVALGNPRQELVALRLRSALPGTWFLGCGGALDMAVGDVDRAPGWLQKVGLEWLHRLRREPGRLWQRYLRDDVPHLVGMLWRAARRRSDPPPMRPARGDD